MKAFLGRYDRSTQYLLASDYLIAVGLFAVVMRLRFMPEIDIIDVHELHIIPQVLFVFVYAACMLLLFAAFHLYKRKILLSPDWHTLTIGKAVLIAVAGYVLLQYFTKSPVLLEYRSVTMAWGVLLFLVLALHRVLVVVPVLKWWSRSGYRRRVVVIGASEVGLAFARRCAEGQDYSGLKVVGFLDDGVPAGQKVLGTLTCLGEAASLPDIVDLYNIEGSVITATGLSYQRLMDLVEQSVRLFGWVDVHSDRSACLQDNLPVDAFFDVPFVRMGEVPTGPLVRAGKRVFDLVVATSALVVLAPVMLAAAAAVALTSSGPILYTTERAGYRGRRFRFHKFRSMTVGSDDDPERQARVAEFIRDADGKAVRKCVNQARITRVGRILRRFAVDELPQLFNVLKGDMSIVGPRPCPVEEYNVHDEWHKRRFDIKPGCTGLWKLFSARGEGINFSQTVLYDIYYARNVNLLLDLYIILGTLRLIARGRADE